MKFHRSHHKRTLLLWALWLSISLLSTQHLQVHVHSMDHEPYSHHNDLLLDSSEHSHIATKHLSTDTSHQDHHDEVVLEMNASPESIAPPSSIKVPPLDLLVFYVLLIVLAISFSLSHKIKPISQSSPKQFLYLTPQLRAPPY